MIFAENTEMSTLKRGNLLLKAKRIVHDNWVTVRDRTKRKWYTRAFESVKLNEGVLTEDARYLASLPFGADQSVVSLRQLSFLLYQRTRGLTTKIATIQYLASKKLETSLNHDV